MPTTPLSSSPPPACLARLFLVISPASGARVSPSMLLLPPKPASVHRSPPTSAPLYIACVDSSPRRSTLNNRSSGSCLGFPTVVHSTSFNVGFTSCRCVRLQSSGVVLFPLCCCCCSSGVDWRRRLWPSTICIAWRRTVCPTSYSSGVLRRRIKRAFKPQSASYELVACADGSRRKGVSLFRFYGSINLITRTSSEPRTRARGGAVTSPTDPVTRSLLAVARQSVDRFKRGWEGTKYTYRYVVLIPVFCDIGFHWDDSVRCVLRPL
jgi:hypothetical protein